MKTTSALVAAAVLLVLPGVARAQQMKLQIQNGLVTLETQNVPVRQILAEWARVGGAKIINGEKVVGAPLTLQLDRVPESQALDIVLRGVSGYMLAARQDSSTGSSAFDRILILPTSAAPRNVPAPAIAGFPGPRRVPTPVPTPEPVEAEMMDDLEDENDGPEGPETEEESAVSMQPGMQPGMNPRFQRRPNAFPNPMGGQPQTQPFGPQPNIPNPPMPADQQEQPEGMQPPTAANPFGVPAGASTMPGVISPVPQQEQQHVTNPNATRPTRPPR